MTEHELQDKIRVALSEYGLVFRVNAGKFWQGKLCGNVLTNLRAVQGFPEGFSDLLFIDRQGVAFIEVKTPRGQKRQAQVKFINLMRSYGHRAGFARSVEDAMNIIKGDCQL